MESCDFISGAKTTIRVGRRFSLIRRPRSSSQQCLFYQLWRHVCRLRPIALIDAEWVFSGLRRDQLASIIIISCGKLPRLKQKRNAKCNNSSASSTIAAAIIHSHRSLSSASYESLWIPRGILRMFRLLWAHAKFVHFYLYVHVTNVTITRPSTKNCKQTYKLSRIIFFLLFFRSSDEKTILRSPFSLLGALRRRTPNYVWKRGRGRKRIAICHDFNCNNLGSCRFNKLSVLQPANSAHFSKRARRTRAHQRSALLAINERREF